MITSAVPAAPGWIEKARLTLAGVVISGALTLAAAPAAAQQPEITLDWTAPGDDSTAGRATSYDLRYRTSAISGTDTLGWWNGATQVTGEPVPGISGATNSYTVTGLAQGTTYYFIIKAADEVPNWSSYSNVASGTTCSAPTSAPGQFDAVADTGQVEVSWGSAIDPLAVSLRLYRAQGTSGAWGLLQNLPLPATSPYLDTSVAPGTTYRYRAAWMGAACQGPYTSVETVITPGTPGSPPPAGGGGSSIRAYPNPASGSIRLVIDVASESAQAVSVRVYDMNGHLIATLADGNYPPGASEITWARMGRDGAQVGPGYYELLGTVGSTRVRERLVLLP